MATININQQMDVIPLDEGSENWLSVVHEKTIKNRMCAIPAQYFDVLKTRGLVDGASGNTKTTGRGNTYFLQIVKPALAARKAEKAKAVEKAKKAVKKSKKK
jgi:hypothetical protein